jgi:Na+/H+ antiporter NhaB
VNELNSWMLGSRLFAAAGTFPAAAAAVSVVGIVVAVSVGFYAVKKAREVNAASVDLRSLPGDDE